MHFDVRQKNLSHTTKQNMNTENTDSNDEALKLSQEDGFDATLNPGLANVEKEQVLRVEETLTASFSGVRSCGDSARAASEAKNRLEQWVQTKLFEYRDLQYLGYGTGEGRHTWSNSTGPWPENRRSCRGTVTFPAYIEFKKNS